MAQYANFDHTVAQPAPVLGWYDTDFVTYPNMPQDADLLVLTQDQWNAHMTNPGGWAVHAGALVSYTPPVIAPTLAEQAATLLAQKLAGGLALTSTGTPSLSGTYALDATSTAQIFQIGLYASQFGTFPSGGATQPYPDTSGTPHVFSVAEFIAFLRAVAPLVSGLTTQAGIMAQGGVPAWPSQAAEIA